MGYGVLGLLVFIVGNNGLFCVVNEFCFDELFEILDKLCKIVVEVFCVEGLVDVKDGMDIVLCFVDYYIGLLKFFGVNNECVIVWNGEVIELKLDKQLIGLFIDVKLFIQIDFQLQDGDCIYLYIDGYVDQFGGEKMKKFKFCIFKIMLFGLVVELMME